MNAFRVFVIGAVLVAAFMSWQAIRLRYPY